MRHFPQFDSDLSELVADVGVPLVGATLLTRWPSPAHPRAAWRLQFADRSTLKGVRFNTPAVADQVEPLLRLLGDQHFPPIVARRGSAMLFRWIEGQPLRDYELQAGFLRRCALLHGWIHMAKVERAPGGSAGSMADWGVRLEAAFNELRRSGVHVRTEAATLLPVAREHVPARAMTGIIHGDLCAENLIVEPRGRLFVVDNETLQVGALDYDLARTWYRWPMRLDEWRDYREAYSEQRNSADFEAHFPYWAVLVLAESAVWHLARDTGGAAVPLRALRALCRRDLRLGAEFSERLLP
jgi:hypothetical protein